ncbi:MAG TPA: hypothetical protein VFT45_23150 [Longimicrobium sp.]|nr:hypothetical protein [Longimicrobium sp.]
MSRFDEIVHGFRRECAEDYVGLWQISHVLKEHGDDVGTEQIVAVVAALLEDPEIAVGQFDDGRFVEWTGSPEGRIERIRGELIQLGAAPDIGDVAWLVQRPGERDPRQS